MTKETPSSLNQFSSYQVFVVILIAITQFTVVLDFMIMSPLGDMLMKSMKITTSQFGFVVSCYAFSAGISGLLTAGFADRFDRKKLLLFFYIGFIVGTLLCGLANSYITLVMARIITGLFGGVMGSISMAIIADLFRLEQRGRVMGFVQMGFGASQIMGIPIGLYLANMWGWQSPFLMIVGLASVIWLLITIRLEPVNEHLKLQNEQNALGHLIKTVSKLRYRTGFMATSLLSIGGFMLMPWGSSFAINNLHVTVEELPFLFMVSGVSSFIVMPVIGRLSDRIDKFKLFAIASCWLMVMVIIYTNLVPIPFWAVLVINILLMGGVLSRMVPAMALTTALPTMQDRGAFMSINASLQQIAGGVAAVVGGMIVVQKDQHSPLEHFGTLGIVIVCISCISIYMMSRVSKLARTQA